jgi:ribonucleotide reductase alpha subunit
MKIPRHFTKANQDVFATVECEQRTSRISNPDGSVVFEMTDAEIPKAWSQLATDIMVSKYFRKAGVPQVDASGAPLTNADGSPVTGPERSAKQVIHRLAGCWRHWGESHGYFDTTEDAQAFYDELSHMLLHQMCAPNSPQWFNTGLNWAYGITGPAQGHFYCDPRTGELQKGTDAYTHPQPHACQPHFAPVSTPRGVVRIGKIVEQRLVGLEVFDGTADGSGTTRVTAVKSNGSKLVVRVQLVTGTAIYATADHYVYAIPAGSDVPMWREIALLAPGDKLIERLAVKQPSMALDLTLPVVPMPGKPGVTTMQSGVAALVRNRAVEVSDISEVGVEPVFDIQTESGQYLSNGVIVHNCFIQSVSDDLVNPGGIMDLWTREARLFKYGSGTGSNFSKLRGENEALSGGGKSSGLMSFLKIGDRAAGAIKSGGTTRRAAKMVCLDLDHPDVENFVNWKVREELKVACLAEGFKHLPADQKELARQLGLKLDYDFNGEAYYTVSGQNSNNSVRIPNAFFKAVESDGDWQLLNRTNGKPAKTIKARKLWDDIAAAAWRCADPGVQYDGTINDWHTCPNSGRINASNPCVTGDTRVLTPGGIWRRIDQMIHLPCRVVTNLDGQQIHVTDGAFPTGNREVYELRTAGGYRLKLTADHKVWTRRRGWVQARHLTDADEVRLPSKPAAVFEIGEPQDEKFFQLLGLFVSEANEGGSALQLDKCLGAANAADGAFEDFLDYLGETWGETWGEPSTIDGETTTATGGEARSTPIDQASALRRYATQFAATDHGGYADDYVNDLMLCSADTPGLRGAASNDSLTALDSTSTMGGGGVAPALTAAVTRISHPPASPPAPPCPPITNRRLLGRMRSFVCATTAGRRLSDEAFTAGLAAQKHLLRAMFTADATVQDGTLVLHSRSAGLLQDVQMLLLGFGVQSAIDRTQGLTIAPHCIRQFMQHVGLLSSAKADTLFDTGSFADAGESPAGNWDSFAALTPLGNQQVFDLTEPVTHSFVAGGITVHNCSEYMFLDDTACNLASLNVLSFFDAEGRSFDLDAFKHAVRLWTIVLEISVLMASFPSEEIARLSYRFRTLGLGYANLGAMLMQAGIPYDSDKGRAICAGLTAVLTGESYATSAEMAAQLGTFEGYEQNREQMLRVIRNHRRATYNVCGNPAARNNMGDYEQLEISPVGIDASQFSETDPLASRRLLAGARECWNRALAMGEKHGYRNAQTTVIAPTGTIGLLMDCDTTGVEPDFALVKFKKLAGGGYFKIANQSLRPALQNLGYDSHQIHDILRFVMGSLSLHDSPHINFASLRGLGFTEAELAAIEDTLPGQFEISFAFSGWTLGAAVMGRLGIAEHEWQNPAFNLLKRLGFTRKQIDEANNVICGMGTVEGAPHLKAAHYPVFDCANKCGKTGQRFIHVEGHIRMMAAAQPFISGAISKTINLPNEATVDQIQNSYRLSWELGLKANALYRDGSKLSQPLNIKSDADAEEASEADDELNVEAAKEEIASEAATAATIVQAATSGGPGLSNRTKEQMGAPVLASDNLEPASASHTRVIEKIIERIVERPLRRRLPDTRHAITHKFDVAGHEGYITAGLYVDGQPGEVFITMAKEGSTIGGLMDAIATLVSVSLQYGVPVESLVRKFEHVRFEPAGMTRNPEIPMAKSLVDYIFRWLAMEFVPGYKAINAPQRAKKTPNPESDAAHPSSPPTTHNPQPTKKGNGHGHRMEPDSAQPFAYTDEELEQAHSTKFQSNEAHSAPASGHNLRLAIVTDPLSQQGSEMQADAPACDVCGSITVRSGTCYKCLNCGNSMGCS